MHIHKKNPLVISSPLSRVFQMFKYFVLEKNAQNCPENDSISRKSSNTEFTMYIVQCSNGKASETKANESFDNGVFFDIEAKRTRSTVGKFFRSEANMFLLKNLKIEAKRTRSVVRKFISKQSEHVYVKELKNRSEAKVLNIKL